MGAIVSLKNLIKTESCRKQKYGNNTCVSYYHTSANAVMWKRTQSSRTGPCWSVVVSENSNHCTQIDSMNISQYRGSLLIIKPPNLVCQRTSKFSRLLLQMHIAVIASYIPIIVLSYMQNGFFQWDIMAKSLCQQCIGSMVTVPQFQRLSSVFYGNQATTTCQSIFIKSKFKFQFDFQRYTSRWRLRPRNQNYKLL